MKTINIKKIISAMMLILTLFAGAASAQDAYDNDSRRTFSQEELAQMLAPIALYPDPLLSQILMAATYPFDVAEADRWVTKNPYLKGNELDEALQAKDWDVSILALCHYPRILTMMSENLSWTARIGDAFTNQPEDVMSTIQELRTRARAAGNLSSTPEQKIIIEERYIRIEPVSYDYIYVPAYDPWLVYGRWWLPLFPPLPILLPGLVISGPGVMFSPPFYVGFGVFGWSHFNWRERSVVIVDIDRTRRFYRPDHRHRIPEHRAWRPDRERRHIRERRAGEIPKFHAPVVSPRQEPVRKPAPEYGGPEKKRRPLPDQPRGIEKDRRDDVPRPIDRDRRIDGDRRRGDRDAKPGKILPDIEKGKSPDAGGPRVIDKDKAGIRERRVPEADRRIDSPRPPERDKFKAPQPGPIEKQQPVIHDRGGKDKIDLPKQEHPSGQPGKMRMDKGVDREDRGSIRDGREGREDRPERPERMERPERGGMKDREDRRR